MLVGAMDSNFSQYGKTAEKHHYQGVRIYKNRNFKLTSKGQYDYLKLQLAPINVAFHWFVDYDVSSLEFYSSTIYFDVTKISYTNPIVVKHINSGQGSIICIDTRYFYKCGRSHYILQKFQLQTMKCLMSINVPINAHKKRLP